MNWEPLLTAPLFVQLHTFTGVAAVVIGLIQLFGPKGTAVHRALGWGWVVCMIFTAISSFGITELRLIGPFGPLHLLSFWVLLAVPIGLWGVRNGDLWWHRLAMTSVYVGALIAATFLAMLPGRRLHDVVTGTDSRGAYERAGDPAPAYPGSPHPGMGSAATDGRFTASTAARRP